MEFLWEYAGFITQTDSKIPCIVEPPDVIPSNIKGYKTYYTLLCCLQDYEMLAGGRALNESAMCGQLQNSITACVYFLTPHRVKKVDLIMMSALSQLVS